MIHRAPWAIPTARPSTLQPGIYHGFVALEPDTLIYEVKPGPWSAATDKSFAPWAPAEGDPGAMYIECDLGTDCTDCGPR
jgi:hypothetical protein